MDENFQIDNDSIKIANLALLKEVWVTNMIQIEMLTEVIANLKEMDQEQVWKIFEKSYHSRMEEIDTYLKSEFATLDISSLFKKSE